MPPKPDKAKPGAGSKKPIIKDDYDKMDVNQLQELQRRNTSKLNEVRRNRNYFQLEKDQIEEFYNIVKEEVEKTRSHVRNVESQQERMQDTHANDQKVYMQRVVHLEYEHASNIDSIQASGEKERLEEKHQHKLKMTNFARQRLELENNLEKEELQKDEAVRSLRDVERKELLKLKEKFSRQHQQLREQYEDRLREVKEEQDIRRRLELHEVNERQNTHINTLIWNHEAKLEEMRAYYQAITRDNVTLIDALQSRINDIKKNQGENEIIASDLAQQNESVLGPIRESAAEVEILESKLTAMVHCKQSLKQLHEKRVHLMKKIHEINDTYRNLNNEYTQVQRQRNQQCNAFENQVLYNQNSANVRNDQLEVTLSELQDQYRSKNSQFGAVLRASNLEPGVLQAITKKLDDVLSAKNEQLEELRYEVAKATKSHDDMLRVYEARLLELGVPKEEVKFEQFLGAANTTGAGLVTK